jgi:ADP-ribose pyrophosphatase YjhB (NUDIX family)
VGAAIVDGDRALVTVRAVQPEKGKVDVPGGFLEVGEHPVEGLMREVREELGVEVQVDENPVLLATHTYGFEGNGVLAIGLRTRIVEGEPRPADDVAEVRWISIGEVDGTDFAWEHDREFVRSALQGAPQGER